MIAERECQRPLSEIDCPDCGETGIVTAVDRDLAMAERQPVLCDCCGGVLIFRHELRDHG